jgi:hypothetical protein
VKHNSRQYTIEVRQPLPGRSDYEDREAYVIIDTIRRVLRAEAIGNFNPLFCRYANNPRVLVHSDAGDLSDPFRRTAAYAETLFISLPTMTLEDETALRSAGLHPSQTGRRAN